MAPVREEGVLVVWLRFDLWTKKWQKRLGLTING